MGLAQVNWFDLFVAVTAADLYADDAEALASLEGMSAAAWGAAFAGGMLLGGRLLASASVGALAYGSAAQSAYLASAGFGLLALFHL